AYSLGQSAFNDVQGTLDAELRGDATRGDHRIEWMMVTDASGQVVAKTAGAPVERRAQLETLLPAGAGVTHAQLAPSEFIYGTPIVLAPGTPPVGHLRLAITTAALDRTLAATLA